MFNPEFDQNLKRFSEMQKEMSKSLSELFKQF